jgi:hypothetical protein
MILRIAEVGGGSASNTEYRPIDQRLFQKTSPNSFRLGQEDFQPNHKLELLAGFGDVLDLVVVGVDPAQLWSASN